MSNTRFVLRLDNPNGEGVILERAFPNERARDYSESQGRAVESDRAVLIGDGMRNYQPIELVVTLEPGIGRYEQAKQIAILESQIARTRRLEFYPLYFEVDRARLVNISPVERGSKVTLRFYGPLHDFIDQTDYTTVPLI